ncbi:hypothetical protein EYC80_005291 [Monilinia laxa]|uniref:Uncharacterized protein n=1 Tax=Monilinia laxa TaxID=61186 RepID=A0A5N6KL60_MONLA|nr:hypothetical protein EYC80_005291 [Monilinia laxa]
MHQAKIQPIQVEIVPLHTIKRISIRFHLLAFHLQPASQIPPSALKELRPPNFVPYQFSTSYKFSLPFSFIPLPIQPTTHPNHPCMR